MRNIQTKYICVKKRADFAAMVSESLSEYQPDYIPVRMVFFGAPENNRAFRKQKAQIVSAVEQAYGKKSPVVSYVSQEPLDECGLILEVHEMKLEAGDDLEYKQCDDVPYILFSSDAGRLLFLGAVSGNLDDTARKQSDEVFDKIQTVLDKEYMPVNCIVRQWNYLERITEFDGEVQRYQAFNDSRSLFYGQTEWGCGYPSATGIGTRLGGIQVELQAFLPGKNELQPIALDNTLQIAAHEYSQQVLLGQEDVCLKKKTTPKFERAKLAYTSDGSVIYISGTAAIRGELSLLDTDAQFQTQVTLENIEHLISKQTQTEAGVKEACEMQIECFRVYVKNPDDTESCKAVISQRYPQVPAIYVEADICRDELLVEIEGVALSTFN